jgi:hypothetical protein
MVLRTGADLGELGERGELGLGQSLDHARGEDRGVALQGDAHRNPTWSSSTKRLCPAAAAAGVAMFNFSRRITGPFLYNRVQPKSQRVRNHERDRAMTKGLTFPRH